ncbi:MAG: hypothetical protein IKC59_03470 [Clostridia bacterium]|nr:hypothetical protein [Clostridia bacterium]
MSKETVFKIREAEAEAERIVTRAQAEAERMRQEAESSGKALCETTRREITQELSSMNEQLRIRAQEHTERVIAEAREEMDAISEKVKLTRRSAEKIVIGGLEAKCR